MSDDAVREFPCTSCGARLEFAPGHDALQCPYCGARVEIAGAPKGVVREIALDQGLALARKVDASQLSTGGHEVQCSGCGAISVVTTEADRCPFCAGPVVVRKDADSVLVPESVLPFTIDKKAANARFQAWIASRWFAPSDLSARATGVGMDGVYVPYWTFDADTTTRYVGQRGEHYYTEEAYIENGQRKTRRVRHTRWHPASGTVNQAFDDVLVCASKGLPRPLAEGLEPWDLQGLRAYDPGFLAGFIAERYSLGLDDGFGVARGRMASSIRRTIEADIGGDEQRILSSATRHENVTFKHLLLPIWISSFRYGDKVYRFLVNARSGEISGERPYSAVKIALAVIAALIVLVVLYAVFAAKR